MPRKGTLTSLDQSDCTSRPVGCAGSGEGGANYVDVPSAEIREDLRGGVENKVEVECGLSAIVNTVVVCIC
jgi:hypothetical protein